MLIQGDMFDVKAYSMLKLWSKDQLDVFFGHLVRSWQLGDIQQMGAIMGYYSLRCSGSHIDQVQFSPPVQPGSLGHTRVLVHI